MNLASIALLIIYVLIQYIQPITYTLYKANSASRLSLRNLHMDTLSGASSGINYYYAFLSIGNPPQKQSYIVDTGSQITTSPCSYCQSCGKHEHKYFNPSKDNKPMSCKDNKCKDVSSSCDSTNQCSFSISYSEGSSLSGLFFDELISFGDNFTPVSFPIGCTTRETHLFLTQHADGIMGLSHSDRTLPSILYKGGVLKQDLFSLCLSQSGGFFSMGEVNTSYHLNNTLSSSAASAAVNAVAVGIEYIPLQSSSYYSVKLSTITIDSDVINVGVNTNTIIDSGTTIAYFPPSVANKMDEDIRRHCNQKDCGTFTHLSDLGECISFRSLEHMTETIKLLPNITFEFANGVKYIWEPKDYVFNNTLENKKQYQICVGYNQGSGGKVNLGSTWMHNKDIIFDRGNKRIGFINADCSRQLNIVNNNINNSQSEGNGNEPNTNNTNENCIMNNKELNGDKKALIIYILITALMLMTIIFLSIALYRIRKGKNCLCIKLVQYTTPQPIQFDRVIEDSSQI